MLSRCKSCFFLPIVYPQSKLKQFAGNIKALWCTKKKHVIRPLSGPQIIGVMKESTRLHCLAHLTWNSLLQPPRPPSPTLSLSFQITHSYTGLQKKMVYPVADRKRSLISSYDRKQNSDERVKRIIANILSV